nr:MAG TPA: hypothetical protein [Microviridae sp.]
MVGSKKKDISFGFIKIVCIFAPVRSYNYY